MIVTRRIAALLALAVMTLGLFGCAALRGPGAPDGSTDGSTDVSAEQTWRLFQERQAAMAPVASPASGIASGAAEARSFRLRASLSYSSPKRSHRLLLAFRGDYDLPVRLDVAAGIGSPIAFWRENRDGFLAFFPAQNAAFFHEDGRKACAALGFQTPFTLLETAEALSGRFDRFIPAGYAQAARVREGFEYRFAPGAAVSTLVLDAQGRPVRLTGFAVSEDPRPWTVELSDYPEIVAAAGAASVPDARAAMRAATVSMWRGGKKIDDENVESAVLRLKSFEDSPERSRPETLRLDLPPGTQLRRLDESCPLPEIQS